MAGEQAGAQGGAANGDAGATGKQDKDERAAWTVEDWTREIDRRVNEAHKKWRADMQAALAAKDADAESKIAKMQADLREAESRAIFGERALAAGVIDIVAAYAVAKAKNLLSDAGCDFDRLKREHPALFATATRADAAAGRRGDTGDDGKLNMSRVLAQACGIR